MKLRVKFIALHRVRWRQPPILRMIAFDALPRSLRQALAVAGENMSPFEVARLVKRGWATPQIVRAIRDAGGTTPKRRTTAARDYGRLRAGLFSSADEPPPTPRSPAGTSAQKDDGA